MREVTPPAEQIKRNVVQLRLVQLVRCGTAGLGSFVLCPLLVITSKYLLAWPGLPLPTTLPLCWIVYLPTFSADTPLRVKQGSVLLRSLRKVVILPLHVCSSRTRKPIDVLHARTLPTWFCVSALGSSDETNEPQVRARLLVPRGNICLGQKLHQPVDTVDYAIFTVQAGKRKTIPQYGTHGSQLHWQSLPSSPLRYRSLVQRP